MEEVGIYRVAGVMRDVDDLRKAFDTGKYLTQVNVSYSMLL